MLGSCKCKSIVNEKFNNTIDSDNVPSLDVEFANVPHSSPDRMTARGYLITKELIVCSQDKSRVLAARFGRMLARQFQSQIRRVPSSQLHLPCNPLQRNAPPRVLPQQSKLLKDNVLKLKTLEAIETIDVT